MTKTEETKSVSIGRKLYDSIREYCDLNGLQVKEYVNTLLSKAFMEDKYGTAPPVVSKKKREVPVVEEPTPVKVEKKVVEIVVEEEPKKEEKIEKTEEEKEPNIIVKPIKRRTIK